MGSSKFRGKFVIFIELLGKASLVRDSDEVKKDLGKEQSRQRTSQ